MMQATEITNDHLIRALRVLVNDLGDECSPYNRTPEYMRNIAGWIACAATRIEKLSGSNDEAGK